MSLQRGQNLSRFVIALVACVGCGAQTGGGSPASGGAGGRGSRDAGRDSAGGNPVDANASGGARGGTGGSATGGAAGAGKGGAGGAKGGAGGAVGGAGGGGQGGASGGRCTAFQFQPSHAIGVHVLADMNGDGRLDVVAASSDSTGVHVMVYRQTAPRVFAAADQYDYATGNLFYYEGMAVGDLDQDGVPDVAISEEYGSVLLMLSGGGGGYTFASPRLGSPQSEELDTVAIADFDGDGYRDIAVSIYNENLSDGIYWGLGGGAFSVREDHKHCTWGSAVGIVDANEDGRPDLAVACSDGGAQVLINQGGRSFTSTLLPGASETYAFATGDLNSDHHVDVVIPNLILNQLVPSLGDGHGNFAAPTAPLVATTGTVLNAAMGDLDGDGNADVLLTSVGATTIALYRGFGGGYFQDSQPFPIAPVTKRITVGDIDGDGVADLLDGNGPQIIYGPCP